VSSALMIHPLSESHIANSFQLFWTRGIPSSSGAENAINFRIGRDILTFRPTRAAVGFWAGKMAAPFLECRSGAIQKKAKQKPETALRRRNQLCQLKIQRNYL